jgi:GR25 family glycosyltransferase involved in LPS biosynthesis
MKLSDIKTYYINLDKHEEKREHMEKMLSGLGFNYERFPGVEAEWGCEKSHHKLLSEGLKAPFIVLEDDCSLKNEVTDLGVPEDIDFMYLGISAFGYYNGNISGVLYEEITNEISRVHNMLSTHAMLYLSDNYTRIVKDVAYYCAYKANQHFDKSIAEMAKYYEVYALNNPMFYQDNYNKEYTHHDLRKYSISQNIRKSKEPIIVRPEPIKFYDQSN